MPKPSPAHAFTRCCAALCLLLCVLTASAYSQQPSPALQNGHSPSVIALSPDGRQAVTGGHDGLLKWWDQRTGLLIRTAVTAHGLVTALSFSADGGRLLSGGVDGFIRIWDARSGEWLFEFKATEAFVKYATFSPRGDMIASCSYSLYDDDPKNVVNTIQLWDARDGRPIKTLRGHTANVTHLAFGPAGDTLVSASEDEAVKVWSLSTGNSFTSVSLKNLGEFVSFSPDGEEVAATTATWNPSVAELVFFDAKSGTRLRAFTENGYWYARAMSADGRRFVTVKGSEVEVRNADTGRVVATGQGEWSPHKVAVSADGSMLALGGNTSPIFWSATDRQQQPRRDILALDHTTGLAVRSDRAQVAWASGNVIYIWDTVAGTLLHVLDKHSEAVNEVAFSPDRRTLASCSNNEVILWSAADGTQLGKLTAAKLPARAPMRRQPGGAPATLGNSRGSVRWKEWAYWDGSQSVSFSPDGRLLATGELRVTKVKKDEYVESLAIRIWDVATRRLVNTFRVPALPETKLTTPDEDKDPPYWIRSIAFNRDGRTVAADNGSNRVLLLDINTGRFRTLNGHRREVNSVAFSTDGKRLVSASFDGTVKVWNVATGRAFPTLTGHKGRVTTARFSPDGRVVVSGGRDHTVRLWDAASGAPLATLYNHEESVTSVAISPKGQTVFSTGLDGKVSLWSLSRRSLTATLVADSERDWVCFSPDGFYKGNNPEKYLAWRLGSDMYPLSAYREQFSRPDILLARLSGEGPTITAVRPTPTPVRPTSLPTPTPATGTTLQPPTERGVNIRMKAESGQTYTVQLYKNSYALVIGNSDYARWTRLPGVYQDLSEVTRALTRQGFEVVSFDARGEPVAGRPVMNLTRAEFNRQFELFIGKFGQRNENRLLIYYAGHGYTALLPDGRKMGYLVMTDAPPMPPAEDALEGRLTDRQLEPFHDASINMDEIETFAKRMLARHALFVFDSCFAGTVIFRSNGDRVPPHVGEEVTRYVREFLTAGDERQRVRDDSVFRKAFVRGIEGEADAAAGNQPKDGYVLASELYLYVSRQVTDETGGRQTPVFGKIYIPELARGDFVFVYAGPER